jgi:uncharacterized protein YgiM (DUF1202 family)
MNIRANPASLDSEIIGVMGAGGKAMCQKNEKNEWIKIFYDSIER